MFHILNRRDHRKGAVAAVEFEGEPYGSGISFFQANLPLGKGPGLNKHSYAETCVVLSGQAAMDIDGEQIVAGAGDFVVIGPATPHRFTAIGDERLAIFCVHDSDLIYIETLSDDGPKTPFYE